MPLGYYTAPLPGAGVALVIALAGAVMVAIFFFNPKYKERYNGWLQKLYEHVNFDRFLLTSILKFLYVFGVLYALVSGLITLFSGNVLTGLALLVLLPIALRVGFEQLLLLLSIRKETAETNDLLRRMQGLPQRNAAGQQPASPAKPAPPADTRYGNPPAGYPGQRYTGYPQQPPQQQPRQRADGDATQRYTPVRPGEYGAPSGQGNPAGYCNPSTGAAPADNAPRGGNPPDAPGRTPGTP